MIGAGSAGQSGESAPRSPGQRGGSAPPLSSRLLLRAYPHWFVREFGDQLLAHISLQRQERRYGRGLVGAARFWVEAWTDAVVTGVALRVGWLRERWALLGRRSNRSGGGEPGGRDPSPGARGAAARTLEALARDFRHAVRSLRRSPGYAAVFMVTLGLGIGANTAIFSAVSAVLLRPLPHEHGDRLVYLRHSAQRAGISNVLFSVPEIEDYRQASGSLESIAEFSAMTFTMLGHEVPRRVRAGIVSGNYFDVLGLGATLGRTVGREDDGPDAPAVIVLSDAYWRMVFGGDPGVIGKVVRVNGRSATIVGVAEAAPPYPERTDIYVNMSASPHHLEATMKTDRAHRMTEVFARLSPGSTVESARAETAAITSRLHAEFPESYDSTSGFDVTVTPLKTQLTRRARPTLLLLLGTAFFVLIIACANLANLTLTRVLRRDRELAIRVSLGGSRAALRRGLLFEILLLSLGGAGLGLLFAAVSPGLLVSFVGRYTSRAVEISLDASVFGFALLVAVVASVLITMLPSLPESDGAGAALTRSGARSTVGSAAKRLQRVLVVAQIGTSFVLLIGAGLLVRTVMHLSHVDPGFDTAPILTMDIPPNTLLLGDDDARNRYLSVLEDVRALPGVESAALTGYVPLSSTGLDYFRTSIDVDGYEPVPGAPRPSAIFRVVSADYFGTMGIEIREGREFTTTDTEDAQKVVVINESMARTYFGDRDPIGRRITWTDALMAQYLGVGTEPRIVVGVVADTHDGGLDADVDRIVYNAYPQIRLTGSLVLRAGGDPKALVPAVREVILAHDPNQPIDNIATMADLGSESVASRRLNALLLGSFAVLALLIAAVGIGGVLAFSVGSRMREFGVRSALGATRRRIWSGVLGEGALMAAIGLLLGCLAAAVLTRFLSGMLVGVPALDPVTFVGTGVLLGGVAVLASWLPAWRAAAVSPVEALASD